MNYYNEIDPFAAKWLRALISKGLIPDGHVDERSIEDVSPADLAGYVQCHFFAGIGGWPLALQLAGWPTDRPVWTGSCPCQPFSAAGDQDGTRDERHLWPALYWLIRECRPHTVFGEQVAAAIGHQWLDGISSDLEAEEHAVGAAILGAHSVGAPHIRQRLYWVANSYGFGCEKSWRCVDAVRSEKDSYREADRLVHAVQKNDLPFLCRWHDGVSPKLAEGIVHGFGNAIVPQVAAAFIQAFCETQGVKV